MCLENQQPMICKVFDCQISGYNVSSERVRCCFLMNILEDKYWRTPGWKYLETQSYNIKSYSALDRGTKYRLVISNSSVTVWPNDQEALAGDQIWHRHSVCWVPFLPDHVTLTRLLLFSLHRVPLNQATDMLVGCWVFSWGAHWSSKEVFSRE